MRKKTMRKKTMRKKIMRKKIKIGALISGGGSNLQAVIDACNSKKIDGRVVFVGADNFDAKGLKIAQNYNIPSFVVDYNFIIKSYKNKQNDFQIPKDFNFEDIKNKQALFSNKTASDKIKMFLITRANAEAKILQNISSTPFDLLILAGFMRTLSPYFIDKINIDFPKIINIHPSLLPAFPGTDGYGDTFRYGCKVGGCTVHFIDYGEDTGPIIGQKTFSIEDNDTLEIVKEKGLKLEWQLYPESIQKIIK